MSATAATSELRERLVHQGKEVAEVMNDVVRETREKGKAWWQRGRLRLFKFEDVPRYLQDNNYIRSGYRANYTYLENWISLVHFHNESGNVWTHGAAFIAFVSMIFIAFFGDIHPNAAFSDRVVFALFLFSGSLTFMFSTLFHLHLCHSEKAYIAFGCLDYSGISALICGSAAAVTYYTFYCHSKYSTFWLILLIFVNLLGVFGPLFKAWATAAFRKWRAFLYVMSGVLSGAPMLHYLMENGTSALPPADKYFAMPGVAAMAGFYLMGVVVYVARFPERLAPGRFDYVLHSHQIWHLFVVAAAFTHSRAILAFMAWRLDQDTCPAVM
ncbi:Adiponectin receptor protein 1 [Rhizophlyctis rosea]|uniref:Adiponectin receptor protein 1 n=1 Tax=Rhizophlyctis rosea TaxID=64517 RepID=A0AAD5SNS9_9FUNG|nr:Adiponectin receptor protein 1 [Rhizophlyctis rosea]